MKTSRAIPIDRTAIRRLSETLVNELEKAARQAARSERNLSKPILGIQELWGSADFKLRNVQGKDVSVEVFLKAERGSPSPFLVSHGAVGTRRGSPIVVIFLDGSQTLERVLEYFSLRDIVGSKMYSMLIHELTHIADVLKETQYKVTEGYQAEDSKAYFNDPAEVKAFMQQVVDEVLSYYRGSPGKLLTMMGNQKGFKVLLNNSSSWNEGKAYWNAANRQKVLKAVYQALSEAAQI